MKKVCAIFLILFIMVLQIPFGELSVFADNSGHTMESILDWNRCYAVQTADFLNATYDDAESLKSYTYGNWATPEDVVEGQGLKLDDATDYFYWRSGTDSLHSEQAVKIRVYMPNGGIPSSIRIDAPGAGWWTRSASAATETAHTIRIYGNGWDTTVTSSSGEWQTYLFTTDYVVGGENTDKKFKIYKKADGDTQWTTLTGGTSMFPQTGWVNGIFIGGTEAFPVYVASVELLAEDDRVLLGELLWEKTENMGEIHADEDNNEVSFSCSVPYTQGGSLGLSTGLDMTDEAFDISWSMSAENYSGRECVVINTGKHRLYLVFHAGNISIDKIGTIGYPMPYDETNFRVIGKDGIAFLYINGIQVLANVQMPESTDPCGIHIGTYGGDNGELSSFTVRNMEIHDATDIQLPSVVVPREKNHDFSAVVEGLDLGETWSIDETKGTLLSINQEYYKENSASLPLWFSDEFILEVKMRFLSYGDYAGLSLVWPGGTFSLSMRERFFQSGTSISDVFPKGFLGNDWKTIRLESYQNKERVRVYVEGECVGDFATQDGKEIVYSQLKLYTCGTGMEAASVEYDFIHYVPIQYGDATIIAPAFGEAYQKGETILPRISLRDGATTDRVSYYLNGVLVGSSVSGNEYPITLENLPIGAYTLVASCNGKDSAPIEFEVIPRNENVLDCSQKENGECVASAAVDADVHRVDFFLDGSLLGSTTEIHQTSFFADPTKGHSLTAVFKNEKGIVLEKVNQKISAKLSQEWESSHYSNEIAYSIDGTSGEATVDVQNGMNQLFLKHTSAELLYLTDEEEKKISAGNGCYRILTDGSFADIYYEGKHLVSFIMPQTDVVDTSFLENGLRITECSVSVPQERRNYLYVEKVATSAKTYDLEGVKGYYNLDFVAEDDTEARLRLNDTAFHVDLSLKNGKISVETAQNSKSEPMYAELAAMPKGKVNYRLSMEAGMGTLYGNGRFLGSFRATKAVGEAILGVNVEKGELSHLAVNAYNDLFLYQEDFAGNGTTQAIDYWHFTNTDGSIDTSAREMTLDATGKTDGIAELNAFAGNFVMEAEVSVQNCNGGVWFLLNHCVSQTYTRAGYNFTNGTFEIVDRMDSDQRIDAVESSPVVFPTDSVVSMKLEVTERPEGKLVVLYVDGDEVLRKENSFDHRGKVGFILTDGVIKVKSFSYRGDAKPLLDVRDNPASYGITLDMIEKPDGSIYMVNSGGGGVTTDGGKTWSKVSVADYKSEHMLRLRNGQILSYRRWHSGDTEYGVPIFKHNIGISVDDGETWTKQGALMEEPKAGYGNTIHRLTEGNLLPGKDYGRIFFAGAFDMPSENYGTAQVMYSDDKGKTWKTAFEFTYENTGYTNVQEPIVIQTEKWTRCYYRNDKGMIRYFESPDGGISWDPKTSHSTPFFMAMNCFGMDVERYTDSEGQEKEILYLSWSADNENLHPRLQYPRTNWRVARSLDYGETWEFYGTLHENNSVDINQMNLGINVSKDYIIVNSYSADTYASSSYRGRIGMFPKAKQTTILRAEQTHLMYPEQFEEMRILSENRIDRLLAISSENRTALLYGKRQYNACVNDGSIQMDIAAAFVGGYAVKNANESISIITQETTEEFSSIEEDCIDLSSFVKNYHLYMTEEQDVKIVSYFPVMTQREKESVNNALFSLESGPIEVVENAVKVEELMQDTTGVSFRVNCISNNMLTGTVYVALYDDENRLVGMDACATEALENKTFSFSEDYHRIHVFWWDENLRPMAAEAETIWMKEDSK